MVGELLSRPHVVQDPVGHIAGLVLLVGGGMYVDLAPLAVLGPEAFALARSIVADDGIGRVEDGLGRAVVLLEPDDLGFWVLLLEAQNILDSGPPEAVDGLVVVAHHADVLILLGQQLDQHILGVVGVLILVHHDVAEFVLVVVQHVGVLLEEGHGVDDDVVEVHGVGFLEPLFVEDVGLGDLIQPEIPARRPGVLVGVYEAVLGAADGRQNGLVRQQLVVDFQLLLHLFHQPPLVVGVVDGEVGGVAHPVAVPPEDFGAGGMEGTGPDVPGLVPEHGGDTFLELARGLVGKGDGQDLPGPGRADGKARRHGFAGNGRTRHIRFQRGAMGLGHPLGSGRVIRRPVLDQVGDAVDQHGGLTASRPG